MTRPPGGMPPPTTVQLDGSTIELTPLAEAVAERYFAEFPEDLERYGDAAMPWEIHDTLHTLNWAVLDVRGFTSLETNLVWLAKVLIARDFPLEHLARNVELCAEVVPDERVAAKLRAAAGAVRGVDA
jgi:hypothetical protein